MKLLINQTTNTSGSQEVFTHEYRQNSRPQNQSWVVVSGTFDGASVALEIRRPEGEWITVENATFTEAGIVEINLLGAAFEIRGGLTDAGASTSLTLEVL